MLRTRFTLILYFRMTVDNAVRHTVLQALFCNCFLIDDHIIKNLLMLRYFSHRILRLKISSVMLLPALNPVCSSVIISFAWGLSLFRMTFSMTLLE